MMTSKRNRLRVGIIWSLTFPIVAYIAYHFFPITDIDWLYIVSLLFIMCATMLLPVQFEEVSITLERWIIIAVFLQYGMFAEFIFIQIAMFTLSFSAKTSLPMSHRFFTNSIIFSLTSLISAFVFTLVGGTNDLTHFSDVIFYGFIYASTYTFVNNALLKVYFKLDGQSYSLFSKGAMWDYISNMVMFPVGVSLYILHGSIGNKSILLVGIPLVALIIAIRLYSESNDRQVQLAYAAEIGRDLAKQLLFVEVLRTYLEKLEGIVSFKSGYVIDLRSEKSLIPLMSIESGEIIEQVKSITFTRDKEAGDGLSLHQTEIFSSKKEMALLKNITFESNVQSVMTIPIIRDYKTEGFLLLTSARKNAFEVKDVQILDVLSNYFGVSLEKARHYERTLKKSQRCGLTKLHNFRYLNEKMEEAVNRYYEGVLQHVSVIILDIDFFKKINDTYGHENGNVILVELANILRSYQKEEDVLARYGGEEFVLVLPGCSKEEAVKLAEDIRSDVARTIFTITPDLGECHQEIEVQITISLGVATLPVDAVSASELIRNADRALYIGGKQAGRNKVGVF